MAKKSTKEFGILRGKEKGNYNRPASLPRYLPKDGKFPCIWKKDNFKYGLFFTFFLLLWISLTSLPVSAQEHTEGYGQICYPCHDTLLAKQERTSKFAHCRCHSMDIWRSGGNWRKIDLRKLSELHGDAPCIKCHVAPTAGTKMNYSNVHVVHKNVNCSTCHGGNETIIVPDVENCTYCHQGGVHTVHGDVLTDICEGCHGNVINKYAELRSKVGVTPTKTPTKTERGGFSLFELIQRIISIFTGGL